MLSGRPRTYQHGDYHIGNMMIGNDKRLYIIDFNRNDFGDPWDCLLYTSPRSTGQTARSSILFSAGLVPIQDVSTLVSVPQKSPSCKRNFPRPAPVSAPSLRIFDPFASCSAASSPLLLAPPVLLAAFASPFQSRTYSLILILD